MSRRLFIGRDAGGNFRIRAARQGYDALTGPLDGMLFDADAVPCRIINSGTAFAFEATWVVGGGPGQVPKRTLTFAHGVPHGLGFVIVVIGLPTGAGYTDWQLLGYGITTGNSNNQDQKALNNGQMINKYCTPFYVSGDYGSGRTYSGGFQLQYDQDNVYITNYCGNRISLIWQALEL